MDYVHIEALNRSVSAIGLGCQPLGYHDKKLGLATLDKAWELGINFLDTAWIYGRGKSEEVISDFIEDVDRSRIIIESKAGLLPHKQTVIRNSSPKILEKQLHDSLERLGTDYLDVFYIHWPDPTMSLEVVAQTLMDFKEEGLIKSIGASNFGLKQLGKFWDRVDELAFAQHPFNLFERGIEEAGILPFLHGKEIPMTAYRPLCQGLLTGAYTGDEDFDDHVVKKDDPKFHSPYFNQYLRAVEALDSVARERKDTTVLELSVRWVLDHHKVVALWGAWKPEYLEPVSDVFDFTLDQGTLGDINEVINTHVKDPVGPDFLAPFPITGE